MLIDLAAPLVIYTLSAGADLGSTEYALARGARELNPFLQSREARIARGAAGIAVATGLDAVLQKRAPRWRWVPRVVVPLASGVIAIHNVRQGRRSSAAGVSAAPSAGFPRSGILSGE